MLTLAEVLNQIDEELEHADPKRPDCRTNVEIEKLDVWRDAILNHTGKVCPWCCSCEPQCAAQQGGLYCSRSCGHDGPHVACRAVAPDDWVLEDHNIARWEAT